MAVFEWSADLDTGIFEIDLQHRSLVSIANQLHDAIETGKPQRTVEWMLEELALYTRFHFETEEAYMRRYKLDMTHEHRHEHGEMLTSIKRFRRKLKGGDERVPGEVLAVLHDWLQVHLDGSDRKLGLAVKARMEGRLVPDVESAPTKRSAQKKSSAGAVKAASPEKNAKEDANRVHTQTEKVAADTAIKRPRSRKKAE